MRNETGAKKTAMNWPDRVIPLIFVLVAALGSSWFFVAPGHPASVDVWPHLARQQIVYDALKHGFSPFYSFMYYCGFPSLRFYSPLFYFVGGFLSLFTGGNLLLALRILMISLHLLSAWAMYAWLRHRTGEPYGSALGAMVYLLIPWRVLYMLGCANFPQALTYLLMPLAFLALERLLAERTMKQALLLGLWTALLILSHAVYALYAVVLLGLWALLARPVRAPASHTSAWPRLIAAAGVALAISASFVVPFALEFSSHRFPLPSLNLGVPDPLVLLGLKVRAGGYEGVYVGLSVLLVLAIAAVATFASRNLRRHIPAVLGLLLAIGLTYLPALLKEKQGIITSGLPPERFLALFVFFAAASAPSAYLWTKDRLSRRRVHPAVVLAPFALLLFADCLFTLTQGRFTDPREFLAVREDIYRTIAGEQHARVLDVNTPEPRIDDIRRIGRFPASGVIYGGMPTPLGPPYHQFAPRSMLYAYPMIDYVAGDLGSTRRDTITDETHVALALLGVSHLVTLPAIVKAGTAENSPYMMLLKRTMNWDDRYVAAQREPPLALGRTGAGLLLVSNAVRPITRDSVVPSYSLTMAGNWRRLLDTLVIDRSANRLNFIPAPADWKPETLPGLPSLAITNTEMSHPQVRVDFSVTTECYVRLAVSWYPEVRVLLDGEPTELGETADHFVWFRCPAGTHTLKVYAAMTPVRTATIPLSAAAFLLTLGGIAWLSRRRRTAS